ncbi:MAG: AAC(3) family N-acetyltransferase [Bacteroidales bacterium]|jgi:aminoglycoside 3-N-acetyltransferase|nr:AAC(3) family N-acetyltransferase [Bacteroidales bacterium]
MFFKLQHKIWYWIKKRTKVRSWEAFKTNVKRKVEQKIYKQTYSTYDLIELMKSMGLKKGATIFIHSSWDEFYNYTGTINEFINAVLTEIGTEGTLAMPAYPLLRKPDSVFSIKGTPTAAGIIAETFRNYPNVKRSINRHSVCALGPMSDYLLNEHQFSTSCWDEKSPYYKLAELNALVFTFGLGKYFVGTIMHCADSILRTELPYFALFFQKETIIKIKLEDNTIYEQKYLTSSDNFSYHFTNRSHNKMISKYFDKSKYIRKRISNLTVNVYDAKYFIHKTIELGRRGIVVYLRPVPLKKYFTKNN